jgi:hypothetical protein
VNAAAASMPAVARTARQPVVVPGDLRAPAELAGVVAGAPVNGHAADRGRTAGASYPWDKR